MADYFVDFSAGTNGTGTFASPWNRLTSITGAVAGADTVWVRRVLLTETTGASVDWTPPNNIPIVGWPIVGDELYASRPAVAQASWDADALQYATMDLTDPTAGNRAVIMLTDATRTYKLFRIRIIKRIATAEGNTTRACVQLGLDSIGTGSVVYMRYCSFIMQLVNGATPPAYTRGYQQAMLITSGKRASPATYNVTFADCEFVSRIPYRGNAYAPIGTESSGDYNAQQFVAPGFARCNFICDGYPGPWIAPYAVGYEPLATETNDANSAYWGSVAYMVTAYVDCTFQSTGGCVMSGFHPFLSSSSHAAYTASRTEVRPTFKRCNFVINTPVYDAGGLYCAHSHYEDCTASGIAFIDFGLRGSGNFLSVTQGATTVSKPFISSERSGGSAVLDNVTMLPGNVTDIAVPTSCSGQIILRNPQRGTGGTTIADHGRVILMDYDGLLGTWKSVTNTGNVEAYNVTRTGGAGISAMLTPPPQQFVGKGVGPWATFDADVARLSLSRVGEEGLCFNLSAGTRTLTLYALVAGFTNLPTTRTLWVEAAFPTSAGRQFLTTRAASVAVAAALTTDTSTWGLSGTAVKFVLTLPVPADCVCAVSLHTTYFESASARIFVDPKAAIA